MTLDQIAAIIYLLVAFGVPQPTINNVQAILQHSTPQVMTTNQPFTGATSDTQTSSVSPASIQITQTTPKVGKRPYKVSFTPLLSDGSVDENAVLTATSDAPWWFPHGVKIGKDQTIKIGEEFDAFIPAQPGTYTMNVTWEGTNIVASSSITVEPEDNQQLTPSL